MKFRQAALAASIGFAALSSAGGAYAQSSSDTAAAQALFDQAKKLMASGHTADACPKFEESQRLDPAVGTLLNLGRCYELNNRLASAWATYLEAASAAKAKGDLERAQKAKDLAAALTPRVSKLVVDVSAGARVTGLEVTRDGTAVGEGQWGVPIPIDGGARKIVAKAPGKKPFTTTMMVKDGGSTATVTIAPLEDAPVDADTGAPRGPEQESSGGLGTQRIVAIGAGVVGVVGVTLGTVFGLKSQSKHDEAAKDGCQGSECFTQAGIDASNDALSAGNVATVAFIVGGVALAGGVALWFTAPSTKATTKVGLGLGSIRVQTVF